MPWRAILSLLLLAMGLAMYTLRWRAGSTPTEQADSAPGTHGHFESSTPQRVVNPGHADEGWMPTRVDGDNPDPMFVSLKLLMATVPP